MPITLEWHDFATLSPAALYEILRFRQDIFVVEQVCAYPELDGHDQAARHLLLRSDGVLAGYLRLIPFAAEQVVRIGRVAVAEPWRGFGLARRLMIAALHCRDEAYPGHRAALSAQAHLADFYGGFGFVAVSEPYDDYGISHVDMALPPHSAPSL